MHIINYFFILCCLAASWLQALTIMIQPAGNTKHPGRSIYGSYERGLSIQLAEYLKEMLEQKDPSLSIIVPRFNAQTVEPYEQAMIANRLMVDAYIAILLYEQHESNPQLGLYTYAADPNDALKTINTNHLQFIPFDQAHIAHHHTSYRMADVLLQAFQTKPLFTIIGNGVHALPLKNLAGIMAPHIALELSVKDPKKMKEYAQSLVDPFNTMLQQIKQWSNKI